MLVETVVPLIEEDDPQILDTAAEQTTAGDTEVKTNSSPLSLSLLSLAYGEDTSSVISSTEDESMKEFLAYYMNADEIIDHTAASIEQSGVFGPIPGIIAFLLCVLAVGIFQELMGWSEFNG